MIHLPINLTARHSTKQPALIVGNLADSEIYVSQKRVDSSEGKG